MAQRMRPQPLPSNPFATGSLLYQGYHLCLLSEAAAGTDETRLMYARVLGYLIVHIHTGQGKATIAQEVMDCYPDGEKMDKLALVYLNHLFRLCTWTFLNIYNSAHFLPGSSTE
jgi:hypothetical protein